MDTSDTFERLNTIITQGSREAFDKDLEIFKTTLSYLDLDHAYDNCKQQLKQLQKEAASEQVNSKRNDLLYMSQTLRNILCTEFEHGPLQYNKQGDYGFHIIQRKKR